MSNEATDFKSATEMPLEAEIDAREVKKTVKRAMKLIMEENCKSSFLQEILEIRSKDVEELDPVDISGKCSFAKRDLSQQECVEVQKQLIKAIKKQLKKNHTFLVTARLVSALCFLTDETKLKLKKYTIKMRTCYNIMEILSNSEPPEVIYNIFSRLDKI